jgi:hypothetical protein
VSIKHEVTHPIPGLRDYRDNNDEVSAYKSIRLANAKGVDGFMSFFMRNIGIATNSISLHVKWQLNEVFYERRGYMLTYGDKIPRAVKESTMRSICE